MTVVVNAFSVHLYNTVALSEPCDVSWRAALHIADKLTLSLPVGAHVKAIPVVVGHLAKMTQSASVLHDRRVCSVLLA